MRLAISVLLVLLSVLAPGCDTAPPGRRCRTAAECPAGGVCAEGSCRASTGDAGRGDASDGGLAVSVRVEPADVVLDVLDGSPTEQAFQLIATDAGGHEETLGGVTWFAGDSLGTIGADGVFQANGVRGGTLTLVATAGALTTSTSLTVRIHRTVLSPGLGADIAATFDAAPRSPDGAPNVIYPLEGAVMPDNVFPPTVQWDPVGAANDVFRITVTKPSVTIVSFARADAGFTHGWLVERSAWRSIAESDDDATVRITVDRLDAVTGQVAEGGTVRTMRLARGSIYGRVYFWVLNRGRTETLDPRTATATVTVPSPPANPTDGTRCVACHTVSPDGRWLFGARGGDSVNLAFDLTTSLAGDPAPTRFAPGAAVLTMGTFDPTGRWVVGAAGWSGPLRVLDADTGMEAPSTGLPTTGASFPAWSPDGTRVAFSGDVAVDASAHPISGNVYVLPRDGDTLGFGAGTMLHDASALSGAAEGGACDSHPVWTPDSERLVFQHGPRTFSFIPSMPDVPAGALYTMLPDGTGVVRLDAANGGPMGTSAYWPSFAPYITAETDGHHYYWFAFYSRRDYGNALAGTEGLGLRQLWIAGLDADAPAGSDPSFVPYWLPGQDRDVNNISAYWAPEPCRTTGVACGTSGECCSDTCDVGPDGTPVCVPPTECHTAGETCGSDADCCGHRCVGNVCFDELI